MAARQPATPPRGTLPHPHCSLCHCHASLRKPLWPVASGLGTGPLAQSRSQQTLIPHFLPRSLWPHQGLCHEPPGAQRPHPARAEQRAPSPPRGPSNRPRAHFLESRGASARRPVQGGALALLGRWPQPRCLRAELRPCLRPAPSMCFRTQTLGDLGASQQASRAPAGPSAGPQCLSALRRKPPSTSAGARPWCMSPRPPGHCRPCASPKPTGSRQVRASALEDG